MRRFFIVRERYKKIISIIVILLLLPYILTVFINGEDILDGSYQTQGDIIIVEVDGVQQEMLWEEYLLGVLANAIPVDYALEAIKAQAVIIQTCLYIEESDSKDYVFDEPFLNLEEIEAKWSTENSVEVYTKLKKAIAETQNQVFVVDEELVYLPYHYLSAGSTRNGTTVLGRETYDYLIQVPCTLDIESEDFLHIHELTYTEVASLLTLPEDSEISYEDFVITAIDESGYVTQVTVEEQTYSGETFAELLELESSAFSLQASGESLKISVTGMGHGLGLSQNTANYMALEGKTYEEILQYFYVGGQITDYS